MDTEIRLVKCPKCRKILPEPNIPVYKCGGCGSILQAKEMKNIINGNVLRARETNPRSVSSSSSAGGDHDHPSVESLPGSDTRLEAFESGSHSYHEKEGSSAKTSIPGKKCEEGYSLKPNVATCVKEIEDSHGLLEEGKLSSEPISLYQPRTHLSTSENLMDEEKDRKNIGTFTNEVDGSPSSEPLELVTEIEQHNIGNENGKYTNDAEDSQGELSEEGKHSNGIQIFDEPGTHEYLKEFHELGLFFHRVSSEEIFDTLPINPRVPIGSISKSLTGIYYAGDESESSAQVSNQCSRKFKGRGITSTNRSRQKDGSRVENKHNGEFLMRNERLDLSSKFKQPDIFSSAEQDWRSPESTNPKNHTRPIRTSTVAANDEPISRGTNMPIFSQRFHRNGTPANSTEFRRPDTMLGSDLEKTELLRMVHDLEDKINRTQIRPFRGVGEEIHACKYYYGPTSRRNSHADFKYSGQPQTKGWANQPRSSRTGFSGEASLCRNHIDCRCSHCYHQGLHFSPKLSSRCIHCQHAAHPRHGYDNICHSYTPSPQHHTSSEFSNEIQTGNPKQDDVVKMPNSRDKQKVIKRHLRPFCGGAPIIVCYHCSELMQLPADFLLFRRRCHQIRCVSCNKIMKFSLLEKSHLVPYVIKIQTPPPNDPQGAEPVSFSEDFEPSLSRNGSTVTRPSEPSSHSLLKTFSKGKQPSKPTFEATNYRKMRTFMEIYQDTDKNSRYNIEDAGPSDQTPTWMKPSSEIEEQPANLSSRLHRLMGYESPGQVLFAKSEDESEDGMGYYMDQHIL